MSVPTTSGHNKGPPLSPCKLYCDTFKKNTCTCTCFSEQPCSAVTYTAARLNEPHQEMSINFTLSLSPYFPSSDEQNFFFKIIPKIQCIVIKYFIAQFVTIFTISADSLCCLKDGYEP